MPVRRDPPPTEEGWFALHDFRTIDWDAWRDTPDRERQRVLDEAIEHLETRLAVEDADEGVSALYSVLGHKADLLVVHLRPSSAHIGALERQFEATEFAGYTERTRSFVSVTEASGYSERAREYFEGELDENSGLANYIRTRLHPTIPDATHVCFYPMDKRRQPDQNWYDLPFEERAEHMETHGEIGREYGGKVVQMITGAIALDDWEWGVTLWGDDLVDMKDLLYEMRFDPSTSQFADFGQFYVGRRLPPADLPALLAGEPVPADGDHGVVSPSAHAEAGHHGHGAESEHHDHGGESGHPDHGTADAGQHDHGTEGDGDGETESSPGGAPTPDAESSVSRQEDDDMEGRLVTLGLYSGEDYEGGDYGLVLYSNADAQELADEVGDLRENFDHYDSHVMTTVRAQDGRSAVASIWDSERAADTAHGFLSGLPGVSGSFGGPLDDVDEQRDAESSAGQDDGSGDSQHVGSDDFAEIREELAEMDVYAGQPHGEDVYALVLYSRADPDTLQSEVEDLSDGFDRYDTHEWTKVYDDPDSETQAVVSLWATPDAADTASDYLLDLPEVVGWADDADGFSTLGMFYTVKPEHREDFVEKFGTVGDLLAEMDGHRETALLVNTEDENDMFIASQWDSKDDAMAFFRSEEFADTVDWGQDVLADSPRHVFLA